MKVGVNEQRMYYYNFRFHLYLASNLLIHLSLFPVHNSYKN